MTLKQQRDKNMEEFEKIRTDAITKMFDNVDENGIYPTAELFNTLDKAYSQIYINIAKGEIERLDKRLTRLEQLFKTDNFDIDHRIHEVEQHLAYWQDQLNSLTKE